MKETPQRRDAGLKSISAEKLASDRWSSRIAELFADPEFELEWDNDLAFHLARHLQELRRYRGMTQKEVAEKAGSTQPKVALAESGDANLTTETVCRFVEALNGRLKLAIEPAELRIPRMPVWWEYADMLPDLRSTIWSSCVMKIDAVSPGRETFTAGWKNTSKETQSVEASTESLTTFTGTFQIPEAFVGLLASPASARKDK